jgi:Rod binding domain-containing protein
MQPIMPIMPGGQPNTGPGDADLARAARDLEASFLAVMLRESGVGAMPGTFGGGVGEEQFASFLTEAYADKFAERGGIGLAKAIFRSLKERGDGTA